ncbi:hypothetical protein PV760_20275 [Paenarthrobacter sp. CC6]|uniref:hypothetical protein n=1 Tax=Paenarthrobacter sp. CC6 TaxID=3029184 RepID=UPI001E70A97E|nr:hypothetical protein NtRootA2_08910 [Arthrobacter sp. NtRootA2]BCW13689.1 hypothetical protein NtRootA4_06680 [Arthrobacter sp. NtRootA4]BCW22025.1 hypothetical protein NtRootC7_08920 [Arthrobacter sp. NtRootC7]BCW26293.1 hypothetical protein NtRootC45_08930 [Arthrobacter sp. NtRootC45]BCW30562.1 hypothetical protein NtRootD5_08930 [Arthrobacter sp. NtRootD5]
MITSLAALATRIGHSLGRWIEAAYVLDCAGPESEGPHGSASDWTWLPALSGVTVAGAQAIQSHAGRPPTAT